MKITINPKICPLCGKDNGCKAGESTKCWCHDVKVPEALIQKVPLEKQGQACICKECIETHATIKNKGS